MSIEQVARDFISNMTNIEKVQAMIAPDAMASGGALPQPVPLMDSMKSMAGIMTAFPDFKYQVMQVSVNGNEAVVKVHMSGTQTGAFSPMPGMPSIPATGKKMSVSDGMVLTVQGDKVSALRIDSPVDGGLPGMMAQLGVALPGK